MASHFAPAVRARSLENVLADLKEAKSDWEQALNDAEAVATPAKEPLTQAEIDAADRMSEADTRIDDLRAEFDERFHEATGLTWKQIEAAMMDALL